MWISRAKFNKIIIDYVSKYMRSTIAKLAMDGMLKCPPGSGIDLKRMQAWGGHFNPSNERYQHYHN